MDDEYTIEGYDIEGYTPGFARASVEEAAASVQIIPYYAHPHVHTVIIDNTWYDETVAEPSDPEDKPFATVVVTGADQGIDNTFVRISDLGTKQAIFGKGNYQKYGQSSIQADLLFDGNTNVWFCRVMPDDATYSNLIIYAHYREGYILDDIGQETGLKRMEIKFSTSYVDKSKATNGATDDDTLLQAAMSEAKPAVDAATDYFTVPIAYVRASGRGRYGNQYSITIKRDPDAEKEYGMKMYKWGLISNIGDVSKLTNLFSGSLYQTLKYNMSTLISDVLDQYPTGSCPIYIHPFEDSFDKLWAFYSAIVEKNANFINRYVTSVTTDEDRIAELKVAQEITEETFDPLFGYVYLTRSGEMIPYYQNYTAMPEDDTAVDKVVQTEAFLPHNQSEWTNVEVGMRIKVSNETLNQPLTFPMNVTSSTLNEAISELREKYDDNETADLLNAINMTLAALRLTKEENGIGPQEKLLRDKFYELTGVEWNRDQTGTFSVKRKKVFFPVVYTVVDIQDDGTIVYDQGEEVDRDLAEYDGVNLEAEKGILLAGGTDGIFGEVSVNGKTRTPTSAEMKLLLAAEEVKAFRGEKDRKILSPARTNVDFIFDANYNMTSNDELLLDTTIQELYYNSTVLTDEDYRELQIIEPVDIIDFTDINVKKAMYDLVEFRNRNGMTIAEDMGAGCSLYLDCGLVGIKNFNTSSEILDVLQMFRDYTGRATSIDLGSYDVYDPYTGKRISVTATYFLAENLVPHIMTYGLNKPFTYTYAQLQAYQRTASLTQSNAMIRDSFKPDIDLIDWDVKEELYLNRINYYLTRDEGRLVERGSQNTRQLEASSLLEENNVRVLNTLKKGLEAACRGYLYEWNEPEARKGYTDSQMAIYRPWIGTMVQDIDIRFDANEWEQERMILHCYCVVKFRDIVKRVILEINIQRPEY